MNENPDLVLDVARLARALDCFALSYMREAQSTNDPAGFAAHLADCLSLAGLVHMGSPVADFRRLVNVVESGARAWGDMPAKISGNLTETWSQWLASLLLRDGYGLDAASRDPARPPRDMAAVDRVHAVQKWLLSDPANFIVTTDQDGTTLRLSANLVGYFIAEVVNPDAAARAKYGDGPFIFDKYLSMPDWLDVVDGLQAQSPEHAGTFRSRYEEVEFAAKNLATSCI